uniref:Pentatricopeptide repeat-containing protein n=1 Tax=Solanum tuberosum TaxID=4113 RepID=M1ACD9_SOLTU
MDSIIFSLSSTAHYSPSPPPFTTSILAGKHHPSSTSILSLKSSSDYPEKPTTSTSLRRPTTNKPPDTTTHSQNLEFSKNPLKLLLNSPPNTSPPPSLTNKLWLSNKLSPPPPPHPLLAPSEGDGSDLDILDVEEMQKSSEFREKGKVFIGNLPIWVKKKELTEFFRQFGPIKNVILIKGHHETEMNKGFGFVIYGGSTAEKAAMKAVEFDGVEFHGRVLTVKLDDGRRMKAKTEERRRWVEGEDDVEYRSKWHEEREGSRTEFRKVLDTEPENWQAVVQAFERIKKPSRKEFGLMVNYYGRRGDMHRARETFEKMRARGIEPTVHVYTNLIHAYAVARDMEEALSCVRRMKDEGIEMSLVTHSILVDGFAKLGNIEAMV